MTALELRELVDLHMIPVTELARTHLGVSRRLVHFWLAGERPIPAKHARRLAAMMPPKPGTWTGAELKKHVRGLGMGQALARQMLNLTPRQWRIVTAAEAIVPAWIETIVKRWR